MHHLCAKHRERRGQLLAPDANPQRSVIICKTTTSKIFNNTVYCKLTGYAFTAERFGFRRGLDEDAGGGISRENCGQVTQRALEHGALEKMRCVRVETVKMTDDTKTLT